MDKKILTGLGNVPTLPVRPYSERLDFAEEIGFDIDRFNQKVGRYIANGNYLAARVDLDFFASETMARLRVAAEYGTIHPRDFLPLAKDLALRVSEIRDEIKHASRSYLVVAV